MPIVALNFDRVLDTYPLVDFILIYHLRTDIEQKSIKTCTQTFDKRVLGIEYSDIVCSMDPTYFDQILPDGQYTYVIGIVNHKFIIGYKQYIHANEIGSKHLCIIKKLISLNAKLVIAGEIIFENGEKTFNLMSGTLSSKVIIQTLDTIINSSLLIG